MLVLHAALCCVSVFQLGCCYPPPSPIQPMLIAPVNDSVINADLIEFEFEVFDDYPIIQIALDSNFSSKLVEVPVDNDRYVLARDQLVAGRRYYWRLGIVVNGGKACEDIRFYEVRRFSLP